MGAPFGHSGWKRLVEPPSVDYGRGSRLNPVPAAFSMLEDLETLAVHAALNRFNGVCRLIPDPCLAERVANSNIEKFCSAASHKCADIWSFCDALLAFPQQRGDLQLLQGPSPIASLVHHVAKFYGDLFRNTVNDPHRCP